MSLACTTVSSQPMSRPKIPKRRLVAQILAFNGQRGWVPVGKKHVFNPRHCSLRDLHIDRQWFTTLLAGTPYTINDVSPSKTFFLSFEDGKVRLMPNASATMATYVLDYEDNHTLMIPLGETLHLRLRAIAE